MKPFNSKPKGKLNSVKVVNKEEYANMLYGQKLDRVWTRTYWNQVGTDGDGNVVTLGEPIPMDMYSCEYCKNPKEIGKPCPNCGGNESEKRVKELKDLAKMIGR